MPEANFGTLSCVYIGLTAAWTLIVLVGMIYLHYHRCLPFLQIRRLPIIFTAVVLLHIYAASCMISITIGPFITAPCDIQFWVMSIYLPFGMALLQAANSQFLHVASQQRQYAQFNDLEDHASTKGAADSDPSAGWWKRVTRKIWNMDKTTRVIVFIGIGMVAQAALTFFIYFGSEIFHPSYGIFNATVPGTEKQGVLFCLTGWEWWLSTVWQFFWAWIYAPYLLWKTRNIRDTHGWRIQTIGCCIAGLPASPLWLASLYTPAMSPVNEVWLPQNWIGLSIFVIEIFIILLPCWQVIKTHNLKQETLEAIAAWEKRKARMSGDMEHLETAESSKRSSTLKRLSVISQSGKSKSSSHKTSDTRRTETLTVVGLEQALKTNPQPLLEFAALKDFSGENVSFLSHVADWRRAWTVPAVDEAARTREQFMRAVRIYAHFVSIEYSEFPVNISSRIAKELFLVFGNAANILKRSQKRRTSDTVTPFDLAPRSDSEEPSSSPSSSGDPNWPLALEDTLGKANLQSVTRMADLGGSSDADIPIPSSFGPGVYDAAEGEIKYLVLTNTWPKFVHAGFENASLAARKGEEAGVLDGARKFLCGVDKIV